MPEILYEQVDERDGSTRTARAGRTAYRPLFVVACPRSGTTWIQLLLSRHPQVATAPETQIFAYYLDRFRRQWVVEHEGPGRKHQGRAGLSRLLSDQEFDELCRVSARYVLDRIARENAHATVVVEKSPRHALHVDWIHGLFPQARFLHVLRDPRDTVASVRAAARSWGTWAPRGIVDAARLWQHNVAAARGARIDADHYREIRYEDLQAATVEELVALFEWLDLPTSPDQCHAIAEACRLEKLREADGQSLPLPGERSPQGFFRRGRVGGWRDELSRSEVRVVERICGSLMDETGYNREGGVGGRSATVRIAVHDALERLRGGLDWRLSNLIRQI